MPRDKGISFIILSYIHVVVSKDGLISLFYGISTFVGYLMPKSSLLKNSNGINQPIAS